MQNEEIQSLDLYELLNEKDNYEIPIYQRNYAWEAKEIEQLIQDIIDYSKSHPDKNYYIGTLVVARKQDDNKNGFSTIDGQQRLTTLSILTAVIKNNFKELNFEWFKRLNLHYASRRKSSASMNAAFNGIFKNEDYEANIEAAYDICLKELNKKTKEHKISINQFVNYLYKYVRILRVPLPEGTDLNHYFEIMNSRGEQLEKHEVLKAKLMACFNNFNDERRHKYSSCFNLIWEACSNMEKYVQYGFTPKEQRHLIFGFNNWNMLAISSFDELVEKIGHTLDVKINSNEFLIDEILGDNFKLEKTKKEDDDDEVPDRFNTVVNFQNFLLHVLRVQIAKHEVALDDKRLIDIFDSQLPKKEEERIEFVKTFIYNLLRCKFLFDKFIIKREFTGSNDRWSLKSLKWQSSGKVKNGIKYTNTFGEEYNDSFDSDNRKILMLLSMFHVSIPSMSYKYWLNACLNYLFCQFEIDSKQYISYLEHIAKSFVFDRHLAIQPIGFFEMIYKNLTPIKREMEQLNLNKLHFGQIENNLVFNFIDYLLWVKYKNIEKDEKIKKFEYTFRSSVEHYYPQTPISKDIIPIDTVYLHSFGNLCLISHEKNSRLNNHSPIAKKEYYDLNANIDSVKQFVMMKYSNWSIKEIELHDKEMTNLIKENLNSNFTLNNDVSFAIQWFNKFQISDKMLLVRTLLCFGDCTKYLSGDRYNLFDFDNTRESESFKKFQNYIIVNKPKNLNEIIETHLNDEKLKTDFRYLFIKYPKVLKYCKEGNFTRRNDGGLIHLLESERKTESKSKELYTYLIQNYFFEEFNINLYSDWEYLYFNIKYYNNEYQITDTNEGTVLGLYIWNNDGVSIDYYLKPLVNGNTNAIKVLEDYKWERNSDRNLERFGNSKLFNLQDNFEDNLIGIKKSILKLLKNGLGIKLV